MESCLYSLSDASQSIERNMYVTWSRLRTNATGVEGRKGTWWNVGKSVYALWDSASANI